MENITAHSIDSLSEKISRKSFRIATVGLILFIIRIPALRQGRRSRSGRFSERAIYRYNGTLIFGFSPAESRDRKGKDSDSLSPKQCGKGPRSIGGNVGGIRSQIEDGVNGFLVSSVEGAAQRIVQLLRDEKLREQMGRKARQTVAGRFLLTRNLEDYLDLFGSFETIFRLRR